jgi:hypothetical protein
VRACSYVHACVLLRACVRAPTCVRACSYVRACVRANLRAHTHVRACVCTMWTCMYGCGLRLAYDLHITDTRLKRPRTGAWPLSQALPGLKHSAS